MSRRFRLVAWNLDGSNMVGVVRRTESVCNVLRSCSPPPDVILLQDVTALTFEIIGREFGVALVAAGSDSKTAASPAATALAVKPLKPKKRTIVDAALKAVNKSDSKLSAPASATAASAQTFSASHATKRKAATATPLLATSDEWILIAPPESYLELLTASDSSFVLALVRRTAAVSVEYADCRAFQHSVMDRHRLRVDLKFNLPSTPASTSAGSTHISVFTTHLESLKGGSEFRLQQLGTILGSASFTPVSGKASAGGAGSGHAILAGDLNLRDAEFDALTSAAAATTTIDIFTHDLKSKLADATKSAASTNSNWRSAAIAQPAAAPVATTAAATASVAVEKLTPPSVVDAFVAAGRPSAHEFSWDCAKNQNLTRKAGSRTQPRLRYERCLYTPIAGLKQTGFQLIGTERIASAAGDSKQSVKSIAASATASDAKSTAAASSVKCLSGHAMTRFGDRTKPVRSFYPLGGLAAAASTKSGWSCDYCTQSFGAFDPDSYHCDICGTFDLCADCATDLKSGTIQLRDVNSLFPSSHFGICVDFELSAVSTAAIATASIPPAESAAADATPDGWTSVQSRRTKRSTATKRAK